MKSTVRLSGVIALAALIALSMTACGDGAGIGKNPDSGRDGGGDATPAFSGSFQKHASNAAGQNAALFNIFLPEEFPGKAAIGAADTEISGVVKDGGKTLQVTGSYNPITGSFNLSGATVVDGIELRYVISGAIDPDDPRYFNANGLKVSMLVKSSGCNVYIYPVTESSETIGGQAEDSAEGLPPEFLGNWQSVPNYQEDNHRTNYLNFIASPFYMMIEDYYDYDNGSKVSVPAMEFVVYSCTPTETEGLYELILIQPVYVTGEDFPESELTIEDVNEAFLAYLETLGYDESILIRCYSRDEAEINDGQNRYLMQDNTQAGDIKTNFLSDDEISRFALVFIPQYFMKDFQPISTYCKFDAQIAGTDFVITQYRHEDDQNAFLTLDELVDLTLKQEPFVCRRP